MANISANIHELEELEKEFSSIQSELNSIMGDLESVSAELTRSWDGAACNLFTIKLKTQIDKLRSIIQLIGGLKKYARQVAEEMREIDRKLKSLIQKAIDVFGKISKLLAR